jgi:hypothetical protein
MAGSQCLIEQGCNGLVFNPYAEGELCTALLDALKQQSAVTASLQLRDNLMKYNYKDEIKRLVSEF